MILSQSDMTRWILILLLLLLCLPVCALGFDNQRTGFSMGLSGGLARITSSDYRTASSDGELSLIWTASPGLGLSTSTSISMDLSLAVYSADWNDTWLMTSTLGARRYLKQERNTPYFGAAAWLSFDGSGGYDGTPPLIGYLGELSAGYLFNHLDCGLRFQTGRRFVEDETVALVSLRIGYLFF